MSNQVYANHLSDLSSAAKHLHAVATKDLTNEVPSLDELDDAVEAIKTLSSLVATTPLVIKGLRAIAHEARMKRQAVDKEILKSKKQAPSTEVG